MNNISLCKSTAAILATIAIFSLSACSQQSSSSITPAQSYLSSKTEQTGQTAIYGKVTAISGQKITLALGTMKNHNFSGKGGASGSSDAHGNTSKDGKGGASGRSDAHGNPSKDGKGGAAELLTLTGKTQTITITDSSVISANRQLGKRNESSSSTASSESASLSSIKVGSILRVTSDSTGKITSVNILN